MSQSSHSINAVKQELLVEAPAVLNKKFRRMIYNYQTQTGDKQTTANKRRQMSRVPGFKEALKKFNQKPKVSSDRIKMKDALGYITSDERRPHYSKQLHKYNYDTLVAGLKEIKKIRNSKLSDEKMYKKMSEALENIRNLNVFKTGPLSSTDYAKAWDMAFKESIKSGKYKHDKFVKGIKEMVKGIKHFDTSFVKKIKRKYSK